MIKKNDKIVIIIELLSALEHEQWMSWTKYLVKNHGKLIDKSLQEKWKKNWKPYTTLSEEVKEADRIWARKVYETIKEQDRS